MITNIGVSHIEKLGSRENICKAKLEILDGLKPGAPLVLNGDDDLLHNIALEDRPVIRYGVKDQTAAVRAERIQRQGLETLFDILFETGVIRRGFRSSVTIMS